MNWREIFREVILFLLFIGTTSAFLWLGKQFITYYKSEWFGWGCIAIAIATWTYYVWNYWLKITDEEIK